MFDRSEPIKLIGTVHTPIWSGSRLCQMYNLSDNNIRIGELWFTGSDAIAVTADEQIPFSEYLCLIEHPMPPLVKLLDAATPLSIQVHPDDKSAEKLASIPKTEIWYVLAADDDACILYGTLPEINSVTVKKSILSGDIEPLLCRIPVHKGDAFMIPPGLIHSLGAGVTVLEVQDRAGTTYRVKDIAGNREIHTAESAESIRLYTRTETDILARNDNSRLSGTPLPGEMIAATSGFAMSIVQTEDCPLKIKTEHNRLCMFCEYGCGSVGGQDFTTGESLYLPEKGVDINISKNSTVFFVR